MTCGTAKGEVSGGASAVLSLYSLKLLTFFSAARSASSCFFILFAKKRSVSIFVVELVVRQTPLCVD
jgi:hypothetical protein